MNETVLITFNKQEFQSLITDCVRSCLERLSSTSDSKHCEDDPILSMQQCAEFLNVSVPTVYGWINKNIIPHYKPGGGKLYFSKKEVIAWVKKNKRKSIDELKLDADVLIGKGK